MMLMMASSQQLCMVDANVYGAFPLLSLLPQSFLAETRIGKHEERERQAEKMDPPPTLFFSFSMAAMAKDPFLLACHLHLGQRGKWLTAIEGQEKQHSTIQKHKAKYPLIDYYYIQSTPHQLYPILSTNYQFSFHVVWYACNFNLCIIDACDWLDEMEASKYGKSILRVRTNSPLFIARRAVWRKFGENTLMHRNNHMPPL